MTSEVVSTSFNAGREIKIPILRRLSPDESKGSPDSLCGKGSPDRVAGLGPPLSSAAERRGRDRIWREINDDCSQMED